MTLRRSGCITSKALLSTQKARTCYAAVAALFCAVLHALQAPSEHEAERAYHSDSYKHRDQYEKEEPMQQRRAYDKEQGRVVERDGYSYSFKDGKLQVSLLQCMLLSSRVAAYSPPDQTARATW